jgi:plastocyanin
MSKLLTDRARIIPVLVVAVVIAVGATLVIVLAGRSTGDASAPAPTAALAGGTGKMVTVDISMFAFHVSTVTVARGTTVAFTNMDTTEHTATADIGPTFDTGAIHHRQTQTVRFAKPGTYAYKCDFHPFMTGTIIVK